MPVPETLQEEKERQKLMSEDGELTEIWTWRRSEDYYAWRRGEIEYSEENEAEIMNWESGGRPYKNAYKYVVGSDGEPPPGDSQKHLIKKYVGCLGGEL